MRSSEGSTGILHRFIKSQPLRRYWRLAISTLCVILFVTSTITTVTAQSIPKRLTMVTSPDYPPYEFYETKGQERKIVGFDVDIANAIAQELGFELTIQESDFNGLIPALQAKRADFVMAGMTPTPERRKNVDFSQIYYDAKDTIISPKTKALSQPEQLVGQQIGVQLGTIQEEHLKKLAEKYPGIGIKQLNRVPDIIQEIKSNRIAAAIVEDTVANGFVAANPDLVFQELPSDEPAGSAISFPKGSPLVTPFNQVLTTLKASGRLDQLAQQWFTRSIAPDQSPTPDSPAAQKGGLNLDFQRILPDLPFILAGIPMTLLFTLLSVFLGLIWGTVLSLSKLSPFQPLARLANAYTSVFRGTPLLLQLALVYYATPQLTGYDITALQAGVLTFTLNSGAYTSETIRGGIQAVDRGQTEACLSLGVPYVQMMKDVIMPQALKNILPALVNETIGLLKDSSLVSTIGVVEILRAAQIVGANKYIYFEPLLFAGLIYYALVMGLTYAASALENRLRRSE